MISYEQLAATPSIFPALTGHTQAQFDALFTDFQQAHARRTAQATYTKRKLRPRQRAPGAGHPFRLPLRDRLLLTLVWLRVYPTSALLGWLFGLDKSNAWHNVPEVLATLPGMASFPFERPAPERRQLGSKQEVLDAFPQVRVIIDSTEQPFHRLEGWDNQKPFYSGKKKRHTVKAQSACTPEGRVAAVGPSGPGSTHDLALLRGSGLLDHLEAGEGAMTDRGYVGLQDDRPDREVVTPHQASTGHPLTGAQKAFKRVVSGCRVVVEHLLAQVKRFQVLRQVFRSVFGRHGQVFRVVALLVDRRLATKPLTSFATS
jgi:hypothetical protein